MALSERLAILIDINGASAVSELNKVGSAAERELGKAEDKTARMGSKFQAVGIGMVATAATIGAGLYSAGKGAAELEQTIGGTEAVFEGSSKVIDAWAKGADTAAGLSEQSARRLTTQIGGALQGLGYAQDEAAQKAIDLTQIGADLSATYGGTTKDAVEALGSALRGEFDPMEQFNVFLKQSTIDAKAVSMGLADTTANVDQNARAQATLALITEQSGAAQGQFAREIDTTSGKMAVSQAKTENMSDAIGKGFTPVMEKMSGVVSGAADRFLELDASTGGSASTVAGYGVVVLGAAGAVSTLVGWVMKMKTNLVDAAGGVRDVVGGLRTLPGAIQAVSFTAAAAGLYLLTQRLQENRNEADKWASDMTGGGTLPDQLKKVQTQLADTRAEAEKFVSVDVLGQHIYGSNEGREMADKVDALVRKEEELQGQIDASTNAAELQAAGVDEMGNAIEGATTPVNDLTAAVEEQKKAYDDALKALDSFWNPGFSLEEASIAAQDAHRQLSDALVENGATLDLSTEAGRKNRTAFLDGAQAAIEYGQKILDAGGSTDEATAAVMGHVDQLREQLRLAGLNKDEIDLYVAALGLTPESISTAFHTPGLDQAQVQTQAVRDNLDYIRANGNITFTMDGRLTRDGSGTGGRAYGGSVMPNSVHPIGERGTSEIVNTPSGSMLVMGNEGGSVRPVSTQQAGGGQVQTVVVQIDGREIARAMVDYNAGLN